MSASRATVRALAARRTHALRLHGSPSHKLSEDRVRKQVAGAWLRIAATCEEQAEAMGFADHTRVVQFRRGEGAAANFALLVVALELADISAEPLFTELRALQLAARSWRLSDVEVQDRLRIGIETESPLQGAEDLATARAAATGCARTLIVGMAPETDAQMDILALAYIADSRGIPVRL